MSRHRLLGLSASAVAVDGPPDVKIDTLQSIELAEGVEVQLRTAGLMVRSWAFLFDALIRIGILIGVNFALALLFGILGGEVPSGMFLLVMFFIEWFYPTLFECGKRGATPGKRMMGLRVVRESGAPVTFGQALLRNLMRVADMLPFAYGFGMVSCLFTKKFQRLGDLVAGTLVIYTARGGREAPPIQLLIQPKSPGAALQREEQAAISEFMARASLWSPERRAELADHLTELTGSTGQQGVGEVFAIAEWLRDPTGGKAR